MKKQFKKMNCGRKIIFLISFVILQVCGQHGAWAQCQPAIKIDGIQQLVGHSDATSWVSLPLWLTSGQTLELDQMVNSISVIEFSASGATLAFSQVRSITTVQTVPSDKVWKVESIARQRSIATIPSGVTYNAPGTQSFTVPACVTFLCIEVWGGGGGGSNGFYSGGYVSGGAGGGGGYGRDCFTVTPGFTYPVIVGAGGISNGNGGASSVGALISATGGICNANSTTGGTGGTSAATFNISGGNGSAGFSYTGGTGGTAGNGGTGGAGGSSANGIAPGVTGGAPGGGGGGGAGNSNYGGSSGGFGGAGQVRISW